MTPPRDPAPLVAVYIVTWRRHAMLKRAIASALAQTHGNIKIRVVNDDPGDAVVAEIVAAFADPRLALFQPVARRGATANFNLVFREAEADFTSLLEDDNWWEPTFLASQLAVLAAHPDAPLVVGNERVVDELPDGSWRDTGQTVWPFTDVRLHAYTLEGLCGSATLCNSALLVRVDRAAALTTPDTIPVDVTEHFRDRLLPRTIPLNGAPLVNFARTLTTARGDGARWGIYQGLLVGSVFAALPRAARGALATRVWQGVTPGSPRSTMLVQAGLAFPEARALLARAPLLGLARAVLSLARHPRWITRMRRGRRELAEHFDVLVAAPLTRALAESE